MKAAAVANSRTEELIKAYREAASEHGAASESGDYKTANRKHDVLAAVYRELRRRGVGAQLELLPLLTDIDTHVRAWAAAHALEFAPEKGQPVLKAIASKSGLAGLNAQATLDEWDKGTLKFP